MIAGAHGIYNFPLSLQQLSQLDYVAFPVGFFGVLCGDCPWTLYTVTYVRGKRWHRSMYYMYQTKTLTDVSMRQTENKRGHRESTGTGYALWPIYLDICIQRLCDLFQWIVPSVLHNLPRTNRMEIRCWLAYVHGPISILIVVFGIVAFLLSIFISKCLFSVRMHEALIK